MYSLLFLIESKLDSLPESERKVADYILQQKKHVIHQRLSEIAAATGSSTSAVIRLCRSLDIPSFSEMKIMLARDVFGEKEEENSNIQVTDVDDDVTKKDNLSEMSLQNSISRLQGMQKVINLKEIMKAAEILEASAYIHVFGIGLSSSIAYDFANKMQRLGLLCGYYQEPQMQLISAINMKKGMVGLIVTHTGVVNKMIRVAEILSANGVKIISINEDTHGRIASLSDVSLSTPTSEPLELMGASSTPISQLVIIDRIFSAIVDRDKNRYTKAIQTSFEVCES